MKKNILIKICLVLSFFSGFIFIDNVNSSSDFSKKDFDITVSSITPMGKANIPGTSLSEKATNLLKQIIEILMVAIGVIALLVISVGAGYMIFYNGKEEFLTKGRNMIFTGLLALFIALGSYYIINLIRYILYG